MTLVQFERLVHRMWVAFQRFENRVEYRDSGETHEIVRGKEEELAYLLRRSAAHGSFPWRKVTYPF